MEHVYFVDKNFRVWFLVVDEYFGIFEVRQVTVTDRDFGTPFGGGKAQICVQRVGVDKEEAYLRRRQSRERHLGITSSLGALRANLMIRKKNAEQGIETCLR